MFSLKEPKGRIARWLEILSAFEFSIQHRPGSKHGNADGMSRCPSPEECLCSDVDSLEYLKCGPCKKCTKRALDMESFMKINITDCKSVSFPYQKTGHHPLRAVTTRSSKEENDHTLWTSWRGGYTKQQLSKLQGNDPDMALVLRYLCRKSRPSLTDCQLSSPITRHYLNLWDSLVLIDNVIYKIFVKKDNSDKWLQLVTPVSLKKEILTLAHNSILSGHFGRKKTAENKTRILLV